MGGEVAPCLHLRRGAAAHSRSSCTLESVVLLLHWPVGDCCTYVLLLFVCVWHRSQERLPTLTIPNQTQHGKPKGQELPSVR